MRFLRFRTFRPIHAERKTYDDALHMQLLDTASNLGEGIPFRPTGNHPKPSRDRPCRIRKGKTNALLTEVKG
jgi:hypothetical protein